MNHITRGLNLMDSFDSRSGEIARKSYSGNIAEASQASKGESRKKANKSKVEIQLNRSRKGGVGPALR